MPQLISSHIRARATAFAVQSSLRNYSTQNNLQQSTHKKVVGILGGGISGLSAAYYLVKKYGDGVRPIIFEQTDRVGGWMKTVKTSKGSLYEIGPRTIRPAGINGMNTLDLVEELKLDKDVLYVEKSHPTATNRYIYINEKLVKLPSDMKVLFRKQEPFSAPLVFALFRDIFKFRKRADDDTIHSFVTRRFGSEIAEFLTDPLIRGICAGDSKEISVKFLMKPLFELEQKYGSVSLGSILSRLFTKESCKLTQDDKTIGFSNIALASMTGNWAVWSLENGLQSLPQALEGFLTNNNVQIRKNTTVTGISLDNMVDELEVKFHVGGDERTNDSIVCNHLISALPSHQLTKILRGSKPSQPELWKIFETIGNAGLQVTGLTYDEQDLIKERAFGFLVPSSEKSVDGLLGVVFDSHSFPQRDNTVITVMSRGKDNAAEDLNKIKQYVSKTLGITREPSDWHSETLQSCIPQYTIGHYERVEVVRRYIKAAKLPLTLAGASFDGVSVNDCIISGRRAASEVAQVIEKNQECADDSVKIVNKASN